MSAYAPTLPTLIPERESGSLAATHVLTRDEVIYPPARSQNSSGRRCQRSTSLLDAESSRPAGSGAHGGSPGPGSKTCSRAELG